DSAFFTCKALHFYFAIHISYGYRNFYHLRSRIILSTAHHKVKNEAYRPLLFTEEDAIKKYEEEYQKQLEMQNKIA
uniref:hypothetical protein n=1 Tax=Globicatella sulfidifaciens TaxID=136093 RepID=UPI0023F149BC